MKTYQQFNEGKKSSKFIESMVKALLKGDIQKMAEEALNIEDSVRKDSKEIKKLAKDISKLTGDVAESNLKPKDIDKALGKIGDMAQKLDNMLN